MATLAERRDQQHRFSLHQLQQTMQSTRRPLRRLLLLLQDSAPLSLLPKRRHRLDREYRLQLFSSRKLLIPLRSSEAHPLSRPRPDGMHLLSLCPLLTDGAMCVHFSFNLLSSRYKYRGKEADIWILLV